jgi:hypothetical protein
VSAPAHRRDSKSTAGVSRDKQPGGRRWWPVLAPLVILILGASLLWPTGRHQWALSLFRQPARYTLLYFNHASALPDVVVRNKPIRVSFTIGNQEGGATSYRYILTSAGGGSSRLLGEASRILAPGAAWTVSKLIRPTCRASRCRIEVSLPGHPERIDFLITLRTVRGKHA